MGSPRIQSSRILSEQDRSLSALKGVEAPYPDIRAGSYVVSSSSPRLRGAEERKLALAEMERTMSPPIPVQNNQPMSPVSPLGSMILPMPNNQPMSPVSPLMPVTLPMPTTKVPFIPSLVQKTLARKLAAPGEVEAEIVDSSRLQVCEDTVADHRLPQATPVVHKQLLEADAASELGECVVAAKASVAEEEEDADLEEENGNVEVELAEEGEDSVVRDKSWKAMEWRRILKQEEERKKAAGEHKKAQAAAEEGGGPPRVVQDIEWSWIDGVWQYVGLL